MAFTPTSGTFNVIVHNKGGDTTHTSTINISLDGLDEDTTMASLAQQLDAIDGISASVSSTGGLQIKSDSSDIEFAFSGDTSGTLAALGLNTFFTGSKASDIGINCRDQRYRQRRQICRQLRLVSGNGSGNAAVLAGLMDQPLSSAGNSSLSDLYNQMVNDVTQGSSVSQSVAEGYRTFESTLDGQQQAVSGVSIEQKEAVKDDERCSEFIRASAKYIQTVADLLDMLVKI